MSIALNHPPAAAALPIAPMWSARLEGLQGNHPKKLNCCVFPHRGDRLIAYRVGHGFGSDVWISKLDGDWQCAARCVRVPLDLLNPRCISYEDPRLFEWRGALWLAYAGVETWMKSTKQFIARLDENFLPVENLELKYAKRQPIEKNWVYFTQGDSLYAVYSISPKHCVLKIDASGNAVEEHASICHLPCEQDHCRGGANPVLYDGEYYAFFHLSTRVNNPRHCRLGLYTFAAQPPFRITRILPHYLAVAGRDLPADIGHHTLYPCGAFTHDNQWFVSCGEHDTFCRLLSFDINQLDGALEYIGARDHGSDKIKDIETMLLPDDPFVADWKKFKPDYLLLHAIAAAARPQRIIEIGVRAGYSGFALLAASCRARYTGYDCDREGYLDRGEKNLRAAFPEATFEFRRERSQTVAKLPAADLVFIDGEHTYDSCLHDLEISDAPLILVDDVRMSPILKAVEEFCARHALTYHFLPTVRGLAIIRKC